MSEQDARTAVAWFEIPATDFERTAAFYEAVLAVPLQRETIGGSRLAVFPYTRPGVGGAVVEAGRLTPGGTGTLVYLTCGDLADVIGRVEAAGGRLAGPLTDLPPGMGSFVHVFDPDGNRVGLHAA